MKTETSYCDIIQRIEEGTSEVLVGDIKYKIRGTMLVAHHKDQSEESEYWRVVMPESSEIRRLVIAELHEIPFMAHPGISRTVSNARNSFYWKGMASDIKEFVEACLFANWSKQTIPWQKANSSLQKFQKLNGKKLAWTLLKICLEHNQGIHVY